MTLNKEFLNIKVKAFVNKRNNQISFIVNKNHSKDFVELFNRNNKKVFDLKFPRGAK
jgi:hypothetical protein